MTFSLTSGATCRATPCTYSWKLGSIGTESWPLGTGAPLKYAFTEAGTTYVQLTVSDARGRTASTVNAVVVAARQPRRRRPRHADGHADADGHPDAGLAAGGVFVCAVEPGHGAAGDVLVDECCVVRRRAVLVRVG